MQERIIKITTGDAHSLVLMASGRLYTFGYNNKGQCGLGDSKSALIAYPVEQVLEEADLDVASETPKWISIAGGRDHSLAVSDAGTVYAAGNNDKGALGLPISEYLPWFAKVHTM